MGRLGFLLCRGGLSPQLIQVGLRLFVAAVGSGWVAVYQKGHEIAVSVRVALLVAAVRGNGALGHEGKL